MRNSYTALLAAILIFVFGVYAIRWFRSEVRTGTPGYIPVHQCQANLKQIEGAKAMWAEEHHKPTNDTPTWTELVGTDRYLNSQLKCPKGGSYILGRVGERARCSVAGHEN